VTIDTTIENVAESTRRIVFLIDEGDKLKIDVIRFTATPSSARRRCATP